MQANILGGVEVGELCICEVPELGSLGPGDFGKTKH